MRTLIAAALLAATTYTPVGVTVQGDCNGISWYPTGDQASFLLLHEDRPIASGEPSDEYHLLGSVTGAPGGSVTFDTSGLGTLAAGTYTLVVYGLDGSQASASVTCGDIDFEKALNEPWQPETQPVATDEPEPDPQPATPAPTEQAEPVHVVRSLHHPRAI